MGFWDAFLIGLGNNPHTGAATRFIQSGIKGKPLWGPFSDQPRTSLRSGSGSRYITDKLRQRSLLDRINQVNQTNSATGIDDILARLETLSDPSRYAVDDASLEAQARASAAMQYDPVIAQLRAQMKSAQQRAGRNSSELGNMFNSLSSNLSAGIPAINQQFEGTKQSTQQEYDELSNMINQQYANSQKEQEDLFKRLNIEAAAAETAPQQMRDRDYFQNLASKEAQTAQTALGMEQRGATEFTRQGSEIARTEGVQRQADLMSQLSDLLNTYEGQIGSQEAAKSQAYMAGLSELKTQAQKYAEDRAQREFDNYIKQIQLGRDLNKDRMELSEIASVKSPADVAQRALSMGIDPAGAQSIQNIFMSAIGNDPSILAGIDSTFGQALPKEALAARVVEQGRNAGLNRQQLNALQTMALEYFGRR